MKKLFFRIRSAITAAKAAFIHPEIMVSAHFNVMAGMYETILKVQEQKSGYETITILQVLAWMAEIKRENRLKAFERKGGMV